MSQRIEGPVIATFRISLLIVFFLSGASALIYEVVWMRQLTLLFGTTTHATTTVLATFMSGLAAGSYASSRLADRSSRLLLLYACLELGIGVFAVTTPFLFSSLKLPYAALHGLDLPYAALAAGRAMLAALVLLAPTALMGATFPVLARAMVQARGEVIAATGLLYFANTAGAVAGTLLAGFYLIEHYGLVSTIHFAAGINLLLAVGAFLLGSVRSAPPPVDTPPPAANARSPRISPFGARVALLCAGLSGFSALAYEVLLTRALLRYVHNSTYAFTTMLATFLIGITLGSWLVAVAPGRRRNPLLLFGLLEAGVAVGFMAAIALFPRLPDLAPLLTGITEIHSFGDSLSHMFTQAALTLLLPAVFLGAALPVATEIWASRRVATGTAHSIGSVYAVNTLGSVLGSISATFLLIPAIGMQGSLVFLIGATLTMALVLSLAGTETVRGRSLSAVAVLVIGVAGLAWIPGDVFLRTFTAEGVKLLYYREGATDTVGVIEIGGNRSIIYDDRRATSLTSAYPSTFMLGHLPMLLHPGHPRSVLHICFGIGNSLSAVAAYDSVERLDNVELSPHVLDAADYFWTNSRVIHDPRVNTIIDDGRNFVRTTRETYDVITLEPPLLFTAGVINLFTREFYQDASDSLAHDGVMLQWFPVGGSTIQEEKMLFRAFFDVFPHATVWQQATRDGPILLIGTKQPLRIDYQLLQQKMRAPRVREDLDLAFVGGAEDILAMFLFDEEALARFVAGVEPVTEDKTVLDFSMPRYEGSGYGRGWGQLGAMRLARERKQFYRRQRASPRALLTNLGLEDPNDLEARIMARELPSIFDLLPRTKTRESWSRWGEAAAPDPSGASPRRER